jgi:hypothetical protein
MIRKRNNSTYAWFSSTVDSDAYTVPAGDCIMLCLSDTSDDEDYVTSSSSDVRPNHHLLSSQRALLAGASTPQTSQELLSGLIFRDGSAERVRKRLARPLVGGGRKRGAGAKGVGGEAGPTISQEAEARQCAQDPRLYRLKLATALFLPDRITASQRRFLQPIASFNSSSSLQV